MPKARWLLPVFLLSALALVLAHALFLRTVPGFQMDEGLFGDTAHRIASGEPVSILEGMTSYTNWLQALIPAAVMRAFRTTVVAYRAGGVIEVVLGVLLICASLAMIGERRAAALLPGVIAFFPALVINQRWVVEATTFYVLCAGVASLGLAMKFRDGRARRASTARAVFSSTLIVLGIWAGVSAHIVFLAPVLALYLCLLAAGKLTRLEDRLTVLATALALLPNFLKIGRLEPTAKQQITELLAAELLVVVVTLFPVLLKPFSLRLRRRLLLVPIALGVILLIPFLLFIEGHWLSIFSIGFIEQPWLIGAGFVPVALGAAWLYRAGYRPRWTPVSYFLPLAILFVYGMVISAGPRYFEVQFLFVAVAFAAGLARLKRRQAAVVTALWVLQGSLILGLNYFRPAIGERQIDHTFHLWRWHSSSVGFLPKERLLKRLAAEGCSYDNLDFRIRDDNTHGAFRVLKHEWPSYAPPCRLGTRVRVLSRYDLNAPDTKGMVAEGPFWLKDTTNE